MNPAKIKETAHRILHLDETPHELAKAFAVGVFVAFTPTLGFHTATVLLLAWAFRLNKFVALTGTFINNPWTIAIVFIGPTWVAMLAMRKMGIDIPPFNYDALKESFRLINDVHRPWETMFWREIIGMFQPYLTAYFVGTTIAGVLSGFLAYLTSYYGIRFYRLEKARIKRAKTNG